MATGILIPVGYDAWFANPNLGASAPAVTWTTGARGLYDPDALAAGGYTDTQPMAPTGHATRTAVMLTSFFEDYYNRVHLSPLRIDFAAVTADTDRVVRVWSAYHRQSITLNSVAFDSAAGLELTGDAIPAVFFPLEEKLFTLTATQEGPATFAESLIWTFDSPEVIPQEVSGNRARTWVFEPAWPPSGDSYELRYAFKTETLVSRSGKQQRLAYRATPRVTLDHTVFLIRDELRRFKDLMRFWQHLPMMLPELPRFVDTTAPLAPGDTTLAFDALPSWVVAGRAVVLRHNGAQETLTVLSVDGTTITFTALVAGTWPVGTRMHAGLNGYLAAELTADRMTNEIAELKLSFDVTPLSEPDTPLSAAPQTFSGRELFLLKPNWAETVDASMGHEVDVLDFGHGPISRFLAIEFGYDTREATYLARNFAEAETLREFFYRMRGRQGEFYMPTWEPDIPLKVDAPSGTASLRIAGTEFSTVYTGRTTHRALFVLLEDGDLLVNTVAAVDPVDDPDGQDSLITVGTPWPRDLLLGEVVMCGWLPVWHLVSDNLTIEWISNSVANIKLTMETLEDLTAE